MFTSLLARKRAWRDRSWTSSLLASHPNLELRNRHLARQLGCSLGLLHPVAECLDSQLSFLRMRTLEGSRQWLKTWVEFLALRLPWPSPSPSLDLCVAFSLNLSLSLFASLPEIENTKYFFFLKS